MVENIVLVYLYLKFLQCISSVMLCEVTLIWGVKVAQSCLTLCDAMDYTVHGILQARVAFPFPSLGDRPNPGIEPRSPALQAYSLPAEPPGKLI